MFNFIKCKRKCGWYIYLNLRDSIKCRITNDREGFFDNINVGSCLMRIKSHYLLWEEWLASEDPYSELRKKPTSFKGGMYCDTLQGE